MKKRLLVPFTYGVDMYALEYAVQFAKNYEAELVAASLLPSCNYRKGVRLEHIQQSKDYQEAIRNKARQYDVAVHVVEVTAANAIQHIHKLVSEQECEGIVLFVREGQGVLLHAHEVKHMMVEAACKLYILRLPAHEGTKALRQMVNDCVNWLIKHRTPQAEDDQLPLLEHMRHFPAGG